MDEQIKQQLATLKEIWAEHKRRLDDAAAVCHHEQPIVRALELSMSALEATNAAPLAEEPKSEVQPEQPKTPARKDEYAKLTHIQSVRLALEMLAPNIGQTVHVDALVREIYEPISNNDVFYRVKRTIVSEIIRAMNTKHMFRRGETPNTFGLPMPGVTQNAA